MPADTTVKHFHAEQVGAPTSNGVQGTLINVMDACLQDGFGLKAVDSLVVAGGIATATITTGHSLQGDMVALLAGATPAGLNGEKRVLSITSTTVVFDATGISDQTATGTITIKVAPLGWAKVFAATNVAVYRPSSPEATRLYLRVDESADGREARVRGYETMTDASTGTNPFPTTSQLVNGMFWPKADGTTANQRDWTIIGDHRTVYIHLNCLTSNGNATTFRLAGSVWGFGDYKSFKPADPYACALFGANSTGQYAAAGAQGGAVEYSRIDADVTNQAYIARGFTGVAGAIPSFKRSESLFLTNGVNSGAASDFTFPNGPDNGMLMTRMLLGMTLNSQVHLQGRTRGAYRIPQNAHGSFSQRAKLDGTGELTGRKLLVVKCGAARTTGSTAMMLFDITGPWEA